MLTPIELPDGNVKEGYLPVFSHALRKKASMMALKICREYRREVQIEEYTRDGVVCGWVVWIKHHRVL